MLERSAVKIASCVLMGERGREAPTYQIHIDKRNEGLAMLEATNPVERMKARAAATGRLAVLWTGNDGWLLSDGKTVLAMDLDFHLEERLAPPPVTVPDLAPHLDLLMISHAHDDHFNAKTVAELVSLSNCSFMLPVSCLEKADQTGIPADRRLMMQPEWKREHLGIEFAAFRALHGHIGQSVYRGASLGDCGYLFLYAGCRIYQPGDTVLLQEHLEMPPVDILFISPTDHNTHIEPSYRMIEAMKPRSIIAQHFGTYRTDAGNDFWTRGYVDELVDRLPEPYRKRVVIPTPGELYLFDAAA